VDAQALARIVRPSSRHQFSAFVTRRKLPVPPGRPLSAPSDSMPAALRHPYLWPRARSMLTFLVVLAGGGVCATLAEAAPESGRGGGRRRGRAISAVRSSAESTRWPACTATENKLRADSEACVRYVPETLRLCTAGSFTQLRAFLLRFLIRMKPRHAGVALQLADYTCR
jgi:hypothetical protein